MSPQNANPSWQAGAHVVGNITGGTLTVPGLLNKQAQAHGGWWALSENSFRLIERSLDDPAQRRKAKTALVTLHRIANLKGLPTFTAQIACSRQGAWIFHTATQRRHSIYWKSLKLCRIKRAQVTGPKLKAPSESLTVFPPMVPKK